MSAKRYLPILTSKAAQRLAATTAYQHVPANQATSRTQCAPRAVDTLPLSETTVTLLERDLNRTPLKKKGEIIKRTDLYKANPGNSAEPATGGRAPLPSPTTLDAEGVRGLSVGPEGCEDVPVDSKDELVGLNKVDGEDVLGDTSGAGTSDHAV